ncbi:lysosome-associated membrane glycoprotein 5-like isoform X2 [Argiope bruennichi]|uniref:lysosome-associated membrane glycoprotein 5-like isoform X2 n=1 Tax=Argiope bruennichi TaxID=94029 RepID=UPI0024950711|nr:lysosome-associated membrane glycoprotein 5-like isoform X2 [Argiope bruennichi]
MFLRASKFVFITLLIYFIGSAIAKPKGDDDNETPSEADKDSPKEKVPEENEESATLKALMDEIKKIQDEAVTEMVPVFSEIAEIEKERIEEIFSTEKSPETEEESVTNAETEEQPKIETPEEKPETTSAAAMVNTGGTTIEKEEAPEDTFAVWSAKGKVCLLAKFHAVFTIIYSSQRGEEKAEITVPKTANSRGKCGSNTRLPLLQLSWGKYAFTLMFNKTDEENWAVTSMELTYDTAEPLFDGAVNAGKKTARSKDVTLFETPLKNSYFCPGQEIILLYAGNKQAVTVRIRDLQLQPFEIENGQFSATHRCNKVVIDEETPYVQDETVPFAIGCTLALITLIILLGFSIHRAYHAAKVDYNSME